MRRKKSSAGHPLFSLSRLLLVLILFVLVLIAVRTFSGCMFQPAYSSRGTLLFLPSV